MFRAGLAFAFIKHRRAVSRTAFESSSNYHNRKSMKNCLSWQRFYQIQFRQIIFYTEANWKRVRQKHPPIPPLSVPAQQRRIITTHCYAKIRFKSVGCKKCSILFFFCYSRHRINMGTITEVRLHMYYQESVVWDSTFSRLGLMIET